MQGFGRMYSDVCHVFHVGYPVASYSCQKDGWVRLLSFAKDLQWPSGYSDASLVGLLFKLNGRPLPDLSAYHD